MLSQSMHPYAPNPHFPPLPSSNGDLDGGARMPHHQSISPSAHKVKARHHHPYAIHHEDLGNGRIGGDGQQMNGSSAGPIRRRISRACDQCNQLRTKCDGKLPCQHCVGQFSTSRETAQFSRVLFFGFRLLLPAEICRRKRKGAVVLICPSALSSLRYRFRAEV